MKKLLLLFTMSCICFYSYGQSAFGIKAGVNLASESVDLDDLEADKAIHPLITASILGHIELSYSANLTLELGLVQTGVKLVPSDNDIDASYKSILNNIRFSPGILAVAIPVHSVCP